MVGLRRRRIPQHGSALIFVVAALGLIGALAAGMTVTTGTQNFSELSFPTMNKARYLADSGLLYTERVFDIYTAKSDTTRAEFIDELNGEEGGGRHTLGGTDYFQLTATAKGTNEVRVVSLGVAEPGSAIEAQYERTATFVFAKGPILHAKLDHDPHDEVADREGREGGNPQYTDGVVDKAMRFDGKNDRLTFDYDDDLAWSPRGAVMCWFKVDRFQPWAGLMHKGDNDDWTQPYGISTDEVWSLQFKDTDVDHRLYFMLIRSITDFVELGTHDRYNAITGWIDGPIEARRWYHVAATWSPDYDSGNKPTGKGMRIYLNGQLNNWTSDYITPRSNDSSVTIGGQTDLDTGRDDKFDGWIDEAMIWNREVAWDSAEEGHEDEAAVIKRIYCTGDYRPQHVKPRCLFKNQSDRPVDWDEDFCADYCVNPGGGH